MKTTLSGLAFGAALIVAGCTFPSSGKVVSRAQAGQVQRIEYGTIEKLSPVVISGQQTQLGTFGGGITGAAAAGGVGQGTGQDLARAGGAVVGAIAGQAVEEGVTRKNGLEMLIKLDSGSMVLVTQAAPPSFNVGDRVAIASGPGGSQVMLP
jgi:outer membrane lipoprotein SlyB